MAMYKCKRGSSLTGEIYGVQTRGIGSSNYSLDRTDSAVGFANPVTQLMNGSRISTAGSSPFDNIMPWAGMVDVDDPIAGKLVAIPKFWYKWTRNINNQAWNMKLQIANYPADGFYVSPAHADRGDGLGEKDVVYVGKYLCDDNWTSTTGVAAKNSGYTLANARTAVHNLGQYIYIWDVAMYWTIMMLYLVEYASWDVRTKLGNSTNLGSNGVFNNGYTDRSTYHTSHMASSLSANSIEKYRNIEGLNGPQNQYVDGIHAIYNSSAQAYSIYCYKDISNYGTANGKTLVSENSTRGCYASDKFFIDGYSDPTDIEGFEYAMFPLMGTKVANQVLIPAYFACSGGLYFTIGNGAQSSETPVQQENMFGMKIGHKEYYTAVRLMKLG